MDVQFSITDAEECTTRRLIAEYARARVTMDYSRIAALLHPDARFIMPANKSTSLFSGECRGRELICNLMRQSDAQLEFYDTNVFGTIVQGNRAAVQWSAMQRNRGTGAALQVSGCAFITQENGLVTEYVHYCDTATINELAQQ